MNKLACKICREIFAHIDLETIELPLNASHFKSHMPKNGLADPFEANANPIDFRCPYCDSFPFHGYEVDGTLIISIFKDNKFVDINLADYIKARDSKPKEDKFVCSCGAEFKHISSLYRHKSKKGHK